MTTSNDNLDIDLSTGVLSTSIAINIPEGRAGIEPQLVLKYNSLNKNGLAGVGWDLSLGYIKRADNKGVPRYDNQDEYFLMQSGAQQKLVDINGGIEFQVEIEESFSKIEFVNNTYWVITSRDGTQQFFGQTPESRVADPADATKVFKYLMDRVQDVHGNYMTISYTSQNADEDRYPDEIRYTLHTNNPSDYARVKFEYETRPDAKFSYIAGFRLNTSKRIKNIDVNLSNGQLQRRYQLFYGETVLSKQSLLTKVRQLGLDGVTQLPDINMEYSEEKFDFEPPFNFTNYPPESIALNHVRFMDMNADGRDDMVYSPISGGDWQIYFSDGTGDFASPVSAQNSPPHVFESPVLKYQSHKTKFADFNGDGLLDVIHANDVEQLIWMNNGQNGYEKPVTAITNVSFPWAVDRHTKYMDMNSDGFVDMVYGEANFTEYFGGWFILYNNGSGQFTEEYTIAENSPCDGSVGCYNLEPGDPGTFKFTDLNGDGFLDVSLMSTPAQIWLNNGQNGFQPPVDSNYGFRFYSQDFLVDINGDGLADWVDTVLPWRVAYNLGNGQFSEFMPLDPTPQYPSFTIPFGSAFIFFDRNGDGLMDVIRMGKARSGTLYEVYINNNGKEFGPALPITEHHPTESFDYYPGRADGVNLAFADINGDGQIDMIYGGEAGYQGWLGQVDPRSARGGGLG